jgi:hypothetical protein
MMTRHVFLARSLLVNFLNSVKNPRSMPDPAVTPELVSKHGLTSDEFSRIKSILGREPNFTELGIFSVMWSEHCSYKNSRLELRKFPTTGPRVLVKAGEENAGVVDIGDGWGVAFKMESHNHPSAVEPFQGAATGVGGILRDIPDEFAALRRHPARRAERGDESPAAGGRGLGHRTLRQLHWRADRGRRGLFRRKLRRQSAGERVLPGHAAHDGDPARRRHRYGQSGLLRGQPNGARRLGGRGVCVA